VWDKLEKRVAKKTSINREQVMREKTTEKAGFWEENSYIWVKVVDSLEKKGANEIELV
jgi:hypothetical protein